MTLGQGAEPLMRLLSVPVIRSSTVRSSAEKAGVPQLQGRRRLTALLAVSSLLFFSSGLTQIGQAQTNQTIPGSLAQLNLEQLGNIEVTSVSKEPEQVWHTAAAVSVITQDDIRRSGATSVPEVLRLVPGVEVAQIDSDHWSIAIRGLSGQFSKDLLVLIDGRSVYTLLYSGVYWDVQNLLLDDVDRIEVIRGPGGTIWGANAVNGVINIITKSSKNTQGALATAGGGNANLGNGAARYGGMLGQNFSYRVYGMGFANSAEFHSDGDGFDAWHMEQMGFHSDWNKGPQNTFTVQGDMYTGQTGERVDIASFSPPSETQPDDLAQVSGGNIVARWQHQKADGSDIQIQAYFDRTYFQDLELGEKRDTFDVDYVQHQRIRAHHELTWGLGARVSPSTFIQTSAVNFLPNRQTDSIYSGFVQYELPIVPDKLTLTGGTKLSYDNFSGFEYQPSVRLLWTPTLHQSLWAAVTRAVRTPSRLDQDVSFPIFIEEFPGTPPVPVFYDIVGDASFAAERLISYEAGYRRTVTRRVYFDFAAFYNVYRGLEAYGTPYAAEEAGPPATPEVLFFVLPYANGIDGNTVGGEIAPDWQVTPWWQLRGSYSYLHMGLKDAPGYTADTGNLLISYNGSSPRSEVTAESRFDLPKRFQLDPTYRYVSALPAQAVSAYSAADLRLGWHATSELELSVVGQNLIDPHHAEFGGDPGPLVEIKRSVYAKITWAHERN